MTDTLDLFTEKPDPFLPAADDPTYIITEDGNSRPNRVTVEREKTENFGQDVGRLFEEKQKKAKPVNHNDRSRTYYERLGYAYWFGEGKELISNWDPRSNSLQTYAGRSFDILGLFDALAMKVGEPLIGVQVVSTDGLNKHLRQMCALDPDKRSGNRNNVDNLRLWLAMGFRAVILQWEQRAKVGSQIWFPVLHEVTEETIRGVESRRKKR
jgi:hypothetical protein